MDGVISGMKPCGDGAAPVSMDGMMPGMGLHPQVEPCRDGVTAEMELYPWVGRYQGWSCAHGCSCAGLELHPRMELFLLTELYQ